MSDLQRRILDVLSEPGAKPLRPAALARRLTLTKKQIPEFREALAELLESKRLREGKKGRLRPRRAPGLITGIVKRVSTGAGYFLPHEAPRRRTGPPAPRDFLSTPPTWPTPRPATRCWCGLTNRPAATRATRADASTRCWCGRPTRSSARIGSEPDKDTWRSTAAPSAIPFWSAIPAPRGRPEGQGRHRNAAVSLAHQGGGGGAHARCWGPAGAGRRYALHHPRIRAREEFPPDVLEEAREQAESFDETRLGHRLDLTGETIVTIDPIDARDFDDAISLSQNEDGGWRLGIHIADVSHFVPAESALDTEARLRGTSVYLPDRVIPMLPEVLSNGLASLQKGKVRFTQSVFIDYSPEGVPIDTEFARSAIRVGWRFAYEDVLALIEEHPDRADPRRATAHPQARRPHARVGHAVARPAAGCRGARFVAEGSQNRVR